MPVDRGTVVVEQSHGSTRCFEEQFHIQSRLVRDLERLDVHVAAVASLALSPPSRDG